MAGPDLMSLGTEQRLLSEPRGATNEGSHMLLQYLFEIDGRTRPWDPCGAEFRRLQQPMLNGHPIQ